MNDFVAKPVEPEAPQRTVSKRLSPAAAGPVQPAGEADWAALLDGIDGLDIERGLRIVRGKWPTYVRILRILSTPTRVAEALQAALAAGDLHEVERLAHALKGSAGNVGAGRASICCGDLQHGP